MSLAIALIEPQIPPNTGNISRLAAATGCSLHLIEPLGFSIDDPHMRRAGLGYWDQLDVWTHPDLDSFREAISEERCLYFSAHGSRSYLEAGYSTNSVLVFGSETAGMPGTILKSSDRVYRIPMIPGVRNINLATSVGVVTYEAIRQLGTDLEDSRLPLSQTQPG